jgi:hypothetical protein
MRATRTVIRVTTPVAAALFTVGLMSSAAWAAPAAPPPPPHIAAKQCTDGRGKIVVDPHDNRIHRCEGGSFNGREINP